MITAIARLTFSTGIDPFLEAAMNRMRFDVKCVKECLVKNKIVYTIRSWEGYTALNVVEVNGIGPCIKKRIMRMTGKGVCRNIYR